MVDMKPNEIDADCGQSDNKSLVKIVPNRPLRELILESPKKVCSVIVEAELPSRSFSIVEKKLPRRIRPVTRDSGERKKILEDLSKALLNWSQDDRVNVMVSSGAIAMNVAAEDLKEIAEVPGVKSIRPNRRHKISIH